VGSLVGSSARGSAATLALQLAAPSSVTSLIPFHSIPFHQIGGIGHTDRHLGWLYCIPVIPSSGVSYCTGYPYTLAMVVIFRRIGSSNSMIPALLEIVGGPNIYSWRSRVDLAEKMAFYMIGGFCGVTHDSFMGGDAWWNHGACVGGGQRTASAIARVDNLMQAMQWIPPRTLVGNLSPLRIHNGRPS
jgi:hypothetical protein